MRVTGIISGGQTGADRGGLEAGIHLGLNVSGWCPSGRRAEDGVIPERYQLVCTQSSDYKDRTRLNVLMADVTLIFVGSTISRGSAFTVQCCKALFRAHLVVFVEKHSEDDLARTVKSWLLSRMGCVLNVAGTRESKWPGMQRKVRRILIKALEGMDD